MARKNETKISSSTNPSRSAQTLFILLCMAPTLSLGQNSATKTLELKYHENDKLTVVEMNTYEGIRTNAVCQKLKKRCQALTTFTKKPDLKKEDSKLPLIGNPAAQHCQNIGGSNRIGKDANGSQYDLCLFEDGSIADSWSIFYYHQKENQISADEPEKK